MSRLTVYYDARCGLCCAVRDWLDHQPQLVPVECRPQPRASDDLRVEADTGETWTGDSAWLVVLWALAAYREWSYRLASPLLLPTARTLFATLSAYRGPISCNLGLSPESR
jgi:hypothetical protein